MGMSIENEYDIPLWDVIALLKKTGFEAISPKWLSESVLDEICAAAKQCRMEVQSLHAPYGDTDKLWSKDRSMSTPAKDDVLNALGGCVKHGIPVLVMHARIGFSYIFEPENICYDAFDEIVDTARKNGVQIAFENTEGREFLTLLMDRYAGEKYVGFCWDSGHEMCYNRSEDLLEKYGDRLIMTHLNDNLGVSRFDGQIYWTDDLHLLPFDGIADWDECVKRLKRSKKADILNFELKRRSKPDRHENDAYCQMSLEQYFAECYKRACRIAVKYGACATNP